MTGSVLSITKSKGRQDMNTLVLDVPRNARNLSIPSQNLAVIDVDEHSTVDDETINKIV